MATIASRTDTSLYQPDSERLQLGIDLFIAKLEKERRLSAVLDQAIRQKESDLRERKQRSSTDQQRLLHHINTLEKKVQLLETNICEVQSYNRLVRSKIDNFRREHQSYHSVISQISLEVDTKAKQANEVSQEHRQASHVDTLQRQKINILRSKSVNERSLYSQRVQEITEVIQKDVESKSTYLRDIETSVQTAMKRPMDHLDAYPIQKVLLEKWKRKLQGKATELSVYVRKIQELESAASQIRYATGINGITEMATAFIKSEEQKYELYTNVNALTSEIDALEENLKRSAHLVKYLESNSGSSEAAAAVVLHSTELQSRSLAASILGKAEAWQQVQTALSDAMLPAQAFLDVVSEAARAIGATRRLSANHITDQNIVSLLSATEESLDRVIGVKGGGSSQFSLEQLTPKRFATTKLPVKPVHIDHSADDDAEESHPVPLSEHTIRRKARRAFESMSIKLPPPH
jgi:hypothetical protein